MNGPVFKTGELARERRLVGSIPMLRRGVALPLAATARHRTSLGSPQVGGRVQQNGRAGLVERLTERLSPEPNTGCHLWTGSTNSSGYGQLSSGGKTVRGNPRLVLVHRVAFELARGPVPEGLVLDHLCRCRTCCNPAHLEPVTPLENTRRGDNQVGIALRARGGAR